MCETNKKIAIRSPKLSGSDSKWLKWNKEQPVNNWMRINQFTNNGRPISFWNKACPSIDDAICKRFYINCNKINKKVCKIGEK